jgi:hypothetical protein
MTACQLAALLGALADQDDCSVAGTATTCCHILSSTSRRFGDAVLGVVKVSAPGVLEVSAPGVVEVSAPGVLEVSAPGVVKLSALLASEVVTAVVGRATAAAVASRGTGLSSQLRVGN